MMKFSLVAIFSTSLVPSSIAFRVLFRKIAFNQIATLARVGYDTTSFHRNFKSSSDSRKRVVFLSNADISYDAKDVIIPEDKLQFAFTRSGGSGGQNVNKVNTKVEIRFIVKEADWLEEEVQDRLIEYQAGKMNKNGELIVTSQKHRTQKQNRIEAIDKLREMIADAMIPPKEREMRTGLGQQTKERRKEEKRFRAKVKENRGNFKNMDY